MIVGIGDQTRTFSDPLFTGASRSSAPASSRRGTRPPTSSGRLFEAWLTTVETAGVEPLVASARRGHQVPGQAVQAPHDPPVHEGVQGVPQEVAGGQGDPALERGQPPQPAHVQEPQTGRAVLQHRPQVLPRLQGRRGRCDRRAEHGVVDEGLPRDGEKPRIWGLHNYRDTNKRKGQKPGGTRRLLKTVKGEVWLTETGGSCSSSSPTAARCSRRARAGPTPR